MSVMDDMLTWLTAVLDATEQAAETASGTSWSNGLAATVPPDPTVFRTVTVDSSTEYVCGSILSANAEHIALHDPRAVLARVAAERAILADIAASTAQYPDFDGGTVNGLENAAMLIAWGHRHDAPGFDPAWAPSNVEVTT